MTSFFWLSIFVVFFGVVFVSVLIGLGALALTWFQLEVLPAEAFAVGLTTWVAILQIYQLFRPVDGLIVAFLFLAGIIELARRTSLLYLLVLHARSISKVLLICYSCLILVLACRSLEHCKDLSTGNYGASAVRWIGTYSLMPGLANVNGGLGVNSSFFLLLSSILKGGAGTIAFRIVPVVMIALLSASILSAVTRLLQGQATRPDIFLSLLTVPLFYWVSHGEFVGTNPNLPTSICCILGIHFICQTLSGEVIPEDIIRLRLLSACALLSTALVFNVTAIGLSVSGIILCLWLFRLTSATSSARRRDLFKTLLIVTAVILPWIARGYILSGYPLYPSKLGGLSVDWKAPLDLSPRPVRLNIVGPGHIYQADDLGLFSLKGLVADGFGQILLITLIAALMLASLLVKRILRWRYFLGIVPCLVGLLGTSRLFPVPEFREFNCNDAIVWSIIAILTSLAIFDLITGKRFRSRVVAAVILCIACGSTFWRRPLVMDFRSFDYKQNLSPFSETKTEIKVTRSGLEVHVPLKDSQCWDAPIPCTEVFDEWLELRRQGDISSGFHSMHHP